MAVPKKKRSSVMVKTRRSTQKLKPIINLISCVNCNEWYRKHHYHVCKQISKKLIGSAKNIKKNKKNKKQKLKNGCLGLFNIGR